ncbi:hypothetical protein KR038_006481 [Drosophila bunnanda]|nr:hypothetical protein KR038_006481 [Drosophila bunnanda]
MATGAAHPADSERQPHEGHGNACADEPGSGDLTASVPANVAPGVPVMNVAGQEEDAASNVAAIADANGNGYEDGFGDGYEYGFEDVDRDEVDEYVPMDPMAVEAYSAGALTADRWPRHRLRRRQWSPRAAVRSRNHRNHRPGMA